METAAAAAAAKSLQSCPTLCDPIDGSPPGSSIPGILQARVLEWVAIAFPIADTTVLDFSVSSPLQNYILATEKMFVGKYCCTRQHSHLSLIV